MPRACGAWPSVVRELKMLTRIVQGCGPQQCVGAGSSLPRLVSPVDRACEVCGSAYNVALPRTPHRIRHTFEI